MNSTAINATVNSQTSLSNNAAASSLLGLSSAASTLAQLLCDIDSGRIADAQQDLATLNRQLGSKLNGASSANRSQFGKLLATLGDNLGSGDLESAQSSVQSFLASLQIGSASSIGSVGATSSIATGTTAQATQAGIQGYSAQSSAGGQLSQQFSALIQNIQAGYLSEARLAYNALVNLLSQANNQSGNQSRSNLNSNGVNRVRSLTDTTSGSQPAALQNLIPALGDSLSSGNLAMAQQNLQAFIQTGTATGAGYVGANA